MSEAPSVETLVEELERLGEQRATGVLTVTLGARVLLLSLREGRLVRVEERGRSVGEQLVQIGVQRGLVPAHRVGELLDLPGAAEPGSAMLDTGMVDPATLKELRSLQVEQCLGQLALDELRSLELDSGAAVAPQAGLKPIRLGDLADDLCRRVEEWPVLVRRLEARDAPLEILPVESKRQLELSERESGLVRMVHGGARTVGQLLERSRYGEFITLRTLHILLDKAVLALGADPDAGSGQRELEQRARVEGRGHQLTTVLVTALVLALLALAAWRWTGLSHGQQSVALAPSALQQQLAQHQVHRIATAVRVHRAVEGRLPATLDELADVGVLDESELRFPFFERAFDYYQEGEGLFVVLPPNH